jgi:hypothetical protein
VPNGGYVLAFGMAALKDALPAPDPITVTAHYLGPAAPGDADVAVQKLKIGRQFCTATAGIRQNGREIVRILATYGDLSKSTCTTSLCLRWLILPETRRGGRFGSGQILREAGGVNRACARKITREFPGLFFELTGDAVTPGLRENIVLFDQEAGVGRDDAIAHAEVHDTINEFFILTVEPDVIEQVADAPRRPQPRNEGFTTCAGREIMVGVGEGLVAAADHTAQLQRHIFRRSPLAAYQRQLFTREQVG